MTTNQTSIAVSSASAKAPKEKKPLRLFLGENVLQYLQSSKQTLAFIGSVTLSTFRFKKFRWMDWFVQMQQCWQSSIFIVSLISFLVGVILAFQSAIQLRQYGAGIFVADLVGLAVVREMGPMMAAIVVAGGTGAGFAAALGNMRINEEIDALETLGISSIDFLVLPRLLAVTIMMPILTLYANLMGILGGLFVSSTLLSIPAMAYWIETQNRVGVTDVSIGIIKSFFFGIMIALTGCWRGMQCSRDTTGVGVATSSAVVTSIMLIVLGDALFAVIYNALGI
ncbi:MAG: ABC transporter permease [Chthoniobacterales bacterium]|nr:ABC transporter permease [Chthoniobacterales bacterium]